MMGLDIECTLDSWGLGSCCCSVAVPKKTQKRDIELAHRYWMEFKSHADEEL
jgi:hypothetical protein